MVCSVTPSWFILFVVPVLSRITSESKSPKVQLHNDVITRRGEHDDHCRDAEDCMETYTPGIEHALEGNYSVAHEPECVKGTCTCGDIWCLSRSQTFDDEEFYYCGPCGRVGSTCNISCIQPSAVCKHDGYCHCYNGGDFYEAYYCFIPYYGYEVALQMAIVTCIIIALCLLVASVYNAIGTRRLRRLYGIRDLLRGQTGTRESPPDDTPPKYDDVIEDLPTYQEALRMTMGSEGSVDEGVLNLAFEDDSITRTSTETGATEEAIVTRRQISFTRAMAEVQVHGLHQESNNKEDETEKSCIKCGIFETNEGNHVDDVLTTKTHNDKGNNEERNNEHITEDKIYDITSIPTENEDRIDDLTRKSTESGNGNYDITGIPTENEDRIDITGVPTENDDRIYITGVPTENDDRIDITRVPAENDDRIEITGLPTENDDIIDITSIPTENVFTVIDDVNKSSTDSKSFVNNDSNTISQTEADPRVTIGPQSIEITEESKSLTNRHEDDSAETENTNVLSKPVIEADSANIEIHKQKNTSVETCRPLYSPQNREMLNKQNRNKSYEMSLMSVENAEDIEEQEKRFESVV